MPALRALAWAGRGIIHTVTLVAGTCLGPYEIVAPRRRRHGRGLQGARHAVARDVAIKLVPGCLFIGTPNAFRDSSRRREPPRR